MTAFKVPQLGESIVEATVSRWLKQEGDAVAAGDTLVELETDKITVEVPALTAGVLTKHAVKEGDVVAVDQLLGELDEGATAAANPAASEAAPPAAPAPAAKAPSTPAPAAAPTPAPAGETPAPAAAVKASPAAQRLAAEQSVDLSTVTGTGRGGVVSKPDVIEQAGAAKPAAAP
ncbi:MAG: sucB, partial [Gemmatimonadetes bacterium]|nr:sucB [Gemmatimonadota bacterium]